MESKCLCRPGEGSVSNEGMGRGNNNALAGYIGEEVACELPHAYVERKETLSVGCQEEREADPFAVTTLVV